MLLLRRGNRGNFPYFCIKTCCDPSLEPSLRDGSNKGPLHMFPLRNNKKISQNSPQNITLSGTLSVHICTNVFIVVIILSVVIVQFCGNKVHGIKFVLLFHRPLNKGEYLKNKSLLLRFIGN